MYVNRLALPVTLLGAFVATLDFFIINTVAPSAQRELDASDAQVQLFVAGYATAYAAGLITGGRLGDRYGRRRVYLCGMALFGLTSLGCGLASTATGLVGWRVAQGLAAALVMPQVLALISTSYQGRRRVRAFTMYGLALSTAAIGGQLLGGWLTTADLLGMGWRNAFLINVPVTALALLVGPRALPVSRSARPAPLDPAGAVLVGLTLLALLVPLVEGRQRGWPGWAWACLAASVALFVVLLVQQRRRRARRGSSLIELSTFALASYRTGVLTAAAFHGAQAAFFLTFAVYLQDGLHRSALESGLLFVPLGAGFAVSSALGGPLARALGRRALTLGALLWAVGQGVLAGVALTGPATWSLVATLLVTGLGMGMVLAPLTGQVLAGVPADHVGAASGTLNTVQQAAGATGLAVLGAVFYQVLGAGSYPLAFAAALAGTVLLALVTAALTWPNRFWRVSAAPDRPTRRSPDRTRTRTPRW